MPDAIALADPPAPPGRSDAPVAPTASVSQGPGRPSPRTAPPKRLVYRTLDAWRGLAALAVVLLHASAMTAERSPGFDRSALVRPLQYGYLGVELFFVISGYCIAAAALSHIGRGEPVGRFVSARLRRIFPPYWFSTLLFVAAAFLMTLLVQRGMVGSSQIMGIADLSRGPLFYVANATLTQLIAGQSLMNPVAWTLCYEVAFYAVFAVAIAAVARRGKGDGVLLALHGLTAAVLLWQIAAPQTCRFPFDMWPHFGAGVLLFDVLRRPRSRAVRTSVAVVGALFAAFLILRDVPIGTLGHSSRLAGGAALLFAALLGVLHPVDDRLARLPLARALGAVGVFSYSLYLINFLALASIRQVTSRMPLFDAFPALGMLTMALATVGLGYLFHRLFERPFLNSRRPPLAPPDTAPSSRPPAR